MPSSSKNKTGNEIKKPLGAFFHFTMEQRPAMAATIKAELDAAATAALAAEQAADPREVDEMFGEPPAEAPAPPAPAVPEAINGTSSSSTEEGALAAAPKKGGTVTTLTAKKLGEMWSTMDEAARAPYDARAAADLERCVSDKRKIHLSVRSTTYKLLTWAQFRTSFLLSIFLRQH